MRKEDAILTPLSHFKSKSRVILAEDTLYGECTTTNIIDTKKKHKKKQVHRDSNR